MTSARRAVCRSRTITLCESFVLNHLTTSAHPKTKTQEDLLARVSEQSSNSTSTTPSSNRASGCTSSATGASQTTSNSEGESTESSGLPKDWEDIRKEKLELEAAHFGTSQTR
ncbi:hypothetical protein I203_103593 [Kwoniella mangroviensis CBS 8507]|uniref:uncharacterized protein n=1 Tax=Kwoniella mangroviensis CBS 8507 TaxID=1296122 RepID=UPI003060C26A